MKKCACCNQEKELMAFYLNDYGRPKSYCMECEKAKADERRLKKKKK
jgi:hypothetical protein